MIEEQYVSFETAKLAKEKGFNEPTNRIFRKDKTLDIIAAKVDNEFLKSDECLCPTQSLLARWLREKYEINVEVVFWFYRDSHYCKYTYNISRPLEKLIKKDLWFDTYEEAEENGLQEACLTT